MFRRRIFPKPILVRPGHVGRRRAGIELRAVRLAAADRRLLDRSGECLPGRGVVLPLLKQENRTALAG